MVEEKGQAMDPPLEEAASVVEVELDPPWERTRRGELEIFDRFLASHGHDSSTNTNLVTVKEAITCMLQINNKSQATDHEIFGDKMVNLLFEAMLNSMALYVVFNKGKVEEVIED